MKHFIIRFLLIAALFSLVPGQSVRRRPIFPTGGGGTDFVTETFTDTDTTLLSSHTGELGATWTRHPTYNVATIAIQSNAAHKDTDSATGMYYASGVPANANYSAEGVLIDLSSANRSSGVCGWVDTTNNTMVCIRRVNTTTIELMKIINGTATTNLASTTVTYTQDLARTLTVTRSGTNYTGAVDGVSFATISITDTELSGAGRVGVRQTGAWTAASTYPITSIRAYQ